jgi:ABC-type lipoprotein export system ATPase subunit/ABC-type antimicrobial peptide transport system permease subunit
MIKVDIKSKIYRMKKQKLRALEDVNFEINSNGLVCILGPSGSGKTTLMNIIGALDTDFEGDIIVNDKSLKKVKNKDLDSYRKNTIGFIFQQFYLLNRFSVYDNVALALTLSNVKNKKKKIYDLLEKVGMDKFAKRKVNVLSGGQKQRVAIARALANDPDVILADEPTGALDSKMGHEIMTMLKKLSEEKIVLVITHSLELANEFADKIIRLEDGRITETIDKNTASKAKDNVKIETKSVMSYAKAFMHSLKSLFLKKGRTIATSIGMSIGIIGIALAFALTNGSQEIAKSQINSILPSNTVSVFTKESGQKSNMSTGFGEQETSIFSHKDLQDIMKLNDKIVTYWPVPTNVMESFFSEAAISKEYATSPEFEGNSIYLMNGFQPFETIDGNLTLGRKPENKNEIVVSLTTAEALLGNDDIDSLVNKDIYVKFGPQSAVGTEDSRNVVLTYKVVGITSVNTMGYSMYQNLNDILNTYEELYSLRLDDMTFGEAYIYLDFDLRNNEIKDVIKDINEKQDKFLFVGAAENALDSVQVFMDTVRNVLIGFSSISVIVAILMIGIVIFISVIERIDEIGIIRAIGGRRKDIRNLFLSESMIIGLLSGTIGVLITMGICSIINSTITVIIKSLGMQMGNIRVAVLDPMVAVTLIFVCIILSLIAGLIPSLQASRMDPIVALRRK